MVTSFRRATRFSGSATASTWKERPVRLMSRSNPAPTPCGCSRATGRLRRSHWWWKRFRRCPSRYSASHNGAMSTARRVAAICATAADTSFPLNTARIHTSGSKTGNPFPVVRRLTFWLKSQAPTPCNSKRASARSCPIRFGSTSSRQKGSCPSRSPTKRAVPAPEASGDRTFVISRPTSTKSNGTKVDSSFPERSAPRTHRQPTVSTRLK